MRTGWTLGVGAELRLRRAGPARLEYLYEPLWKSQRTFPSGTGLRIDDLTFMPSIGLNRKLDWTGDDGPRQCHPRRGDRIRIAGMSTGNLPSSSRAIPLPFTLSRARTAFQAPVKFRIQERDRIPRLSSLGRHRGLCQPGAHAGFWSQ